MRDPGVRLGRALDAAVGSDRERGAGRRGKQRAARADLCELVRDLRERNAALLEKRSFEVDLEAIFVPKVIHDRCRAEAAALWAHWQDCHVLERDVHRASAAEWQRDAGTEPAATRL